MVSPVDYPAAVRTNTESEDGDVPIGPRMTRALAGMGGLIYFCSTYLGPRRNSESREESPSGQGEEGGWLSCDLASNEGATLHTVIWLLEIDTVKSGASGYSLALREPVVYHCLKYINRRRPLRSVNLPWLACQRNLTMGPSQN